MPLQVYAHAVGCVYVLKCLGKPFSRMFSEPQGPGQSQHGLRGLETFCLLVNPFS